MGAPDVRLPAEPPLHGRDTTVRALAELARASEPVLLVAGPEGSGTTRVAAEAAAVIAADRGRVIDARREPGPAAERLIRAVEASGLAGAARGPAGIVAILLGDVAADEDVPPPPAALARVARAVVIATTTVVREDLPTVVLHPLEPEDGARLARAVTPSLDDATAAEVAALADGLPGRIVALARAARDRVSPDAPLPVPESLATRYRARLDALSDPAREVVRWASVLDEPLAMGALMRLTNAGPRWLEGALDELVGAGLLEEPAVVGEPVWRFRERVARAVVEAELPPSDRRRRHAAALHSGRAEGLGLDALIRHAVGAADIDAVVNRSIMASREARGRGDAQTALWHAERAVRWSEATEGPGQALAARAEAGVCLSDLGRWIEGAETLESVAQELRSSGREEEAVEAWCEASNARWAAGEHERALTLIRDLALARAEELSGSTAIARAQLQAAGFANMLARFSYGITVGREARTALLAAGDASEATRALIFIGAARAQAGDSGGLSDLEIAAEEAGVAGGQRNQTLSAIQRSHVLLPMGLLSEAVRCARTGIANATAVGTRDHEAVLRLNLADALLASGALTEARQELEAATAVLLDLFPGSVSLAAPTRAWFSLMEGDLEDALLRFHATVRNARTDGSHFEHVASAMAGHALAAALSGHAEEAREVVGIAIGAWRNTDDRLLVLPLLAIASEVGNSHDATTAASKLVSLSSRWPLAKALALLAEAHIAARGGTPEAADRFRAAAESLASIGSMWWSARARMTAGSHAGKEGTNDLLAARQAFDLMGAPGWRVRCESALRALGTKVSAPKGVTASGALTQREAEVLRQLSEGLTNKQIGERLFISERTVARHLIQVFAKLGVTTRLAAVAAAREAGLFDQAASPENDLADILVPVPLIGEASG